MSVRLVTVSCLCAVALAALTACSSDGDAGKAVVPSAEATATDPACPASTRCYEFTDDSEGWPEISDDQHFAGHDVYLKGSYRVGVREPGSWSMPAPLRISDLSNDYGVLVVNGQMVAAASVATLGLVCPPTTRTQPSDNDVAARPSTATGNDGPGLKPLVPA